jgi:aminoglycoside 2'-N-acetyltransferase I
VADDDDTVAVVLQVAHTAALTKEVRELARGLLEVVFHGEFDEDDWEHSLGGMHVIAWYEGLMVGHAALVQRRLFYRQYPMRAGYVEGVGVHPDWQGRGIGGRLMDVIEQMIAGAYDIGALGASDDAVPFYEHRGWVRWQGPTSVMSPDGIVRTPDEDGAIFVLLHPDLRFDTTRELTCDYRSGDVW